MLLGYVLKIRFTIVLLLLALGATLHASPSDNQAANIGRLGVKTEAGRKYLPLPVMWVKRTPA